MRIIIKMTSTILFMALIITLLPLHGSKVYAETWSFVDGGVDSGALNASPFQSYSHHAVEFNDALYVIWSEYEATEEVNQIRVKKYDGTSWTSAEGSVSGPLNINSDESAIEPYLAEYNGDLYAIWQEVNTYIKIRVKKYDRTADSWISVDPSEEHGLNYSTTKNGWRPKLAVYNGNLYAAWIETSGSVQTVRVKKYNGTVWSTADDNTNDIGLNYSTSKASQYLSLTATENQLYAVWTEDSQVRAKVTTNGSTWSSIDGGGVTGLNKDTSEKVYGAVTSIIYDDELYVTWPESNSDDYDQIRVKKFDGAIWEFVDGNGENGINKSTTASARTPTMSIFNNELYVTWQEGFFLDYDVRVKKYDGTNWSFVDGDTNDGLNQDSSETAISSNLTVFDNGLYASWAEVVGITGEGDDMTHVYAIKVALMGPNNAAPTASYVSISGKLFVGRTLTGQYTYLDAENEVEAESTFKWYTATNDQGADKTVIAGATEQTLVLTTDQKGKYVSFEVTPRAAEGTLSGSPVASAWVAVSNVIKGDANGDGLVTPADVLIVNRYIKGVIQLTADQLDALDMDEDHDVDADDASMIMDIYLGRGV